MQAFRSPAEVQFLSEDQKDLDLGNVHTQQRPLVLTQQVDPADSVAGGDRRTGAGCSLAIIDPPVGGADMVRRLHEAEDCRTTAPAPRPYTCSTHVRCRSQWWPRGPDTLTAARPRNPAARRTVSPAWKTRRRLLTAYRVDECHAAGESPALAHSTLQIQRGYPQLPAFPRHGLEPGRGDRPEVGRRRGVAASLGSTDPFKPGTQEGAAPVVADGAAGVVDDRLDDRVGEDHAKAEGAVAGTHEIDVAWLDSRAAPGQGRTTGQPPA